MVRWFVGLPAVLVLFAPVAQASDPPQARIIRTSAPPAPLADGLYTVQSGHGCPNNPLCDAFLAWDRAGSARAAVTVEHDDRVLWRFEHRGRGRYAITSTWGCPTDRMCNVGLSFDTVGPLVGNATLQPDDPVLWSVHPVDGEHDTFVIRSLWGCGGGLPQCDLGLAWVEGGEPTRATLQPVPIEWVIRPLR